MEYRCYSDASYQAGKPAGVGVVVMVRGCGQWDVHKRMRGRIEASSALDAELRAMLLALKFVPAVSRGIAYSDIDGIESLLAFSCSYAKKNTETIARLNQELQRTGLVAQFMEKGTRPKQYRECHHAARQALNLPTRKTNVRKKVRVKKWWTIRPG